MFKKKNKKKAAQGLQIGEEGSVTPLSTNMYSSPILQFNGPSHPKGGVDINFNGVEAEVEGQETAFQDKYGNLQIMGNMKIPTTNKKFKSAFKDIAKEEVKATKQLDTGVELINNSNPYDKFQSTSFNSGIVLQDAAKVKHANLSQEKEDLATLQNFMLDLADRTGKKPEKISDIMRNGGVLKAKDGKKLEPEKLQNLIQLFGANESSNNYFAGNDSSSAFGKYQFIKGTRKQYYNQYYKDKYKNFNEFDQAFKKSPELQEDVMQHHIQDLGNQFDWNPQSMILAHRLGPKAASDINNKGYYVSDGRKVTLDTPIGSSQRPTDRETPNQYLQKFNLSSAPNMPESQNQPVGVYAPQEDVTLPRVSVPQAGFRFDLNSAPPEEQSYKAPFTQQEVLQPWNTPGFIAPQESSNDKKRKAPSLADRNKLTPLDFLSEIAAVLDKPDFVQGQSFRPNLLQSYQVSFQDRLNENNASFRAAQRATVNNPAAQAFLASQKYNADNQILGEQFRTNQGISNQIINQNTQIMNDAELRNLQLADLQYDRQQQAKAVTDNRRQQAFASISNKLGQNRRDNNTIRLQENLFNFRPDENMQLQNYNETPNFYSSRGISNSPYRTVVTTDETGNQKIKQIIPSQQEQQEDYYDMERKRRASTRFKFGGRLSKKMNK